MVKSSRPGTLRFELNSQVNLLANQFSNSLFVGGERALNANDKQMSHLGSTSSEQPKSSSDLASMSSITLAEAQCGVQVSNPKYSALGFEVDLSGSQNSDTPFLLPSVGNLALMSRDPKHCTPTLCARKLVLLKRRRLKEDLFKMRRAQRLSSSTTVSKLKYAARQRLLTDLSLMVPGAIERIKRQDPSGNGELDWSVLQSWLEGQPDLKAQMNLTTRALSLIATYKGAEVEARSLHALMIDASFVCSIDPDKYKELCSFVFPKDICFSPDGSGCM